MQTIDLVREYESAAAEEAAAFRVIMQPGGFGAYKAARERAREAWKAIQTALEAEA